MKMLTNYISALSNATGNILKEGFCIIVSKITNYLTFAYTEIKSRVAKFIKKNEGHKIMI
jgi:hypothetical protein